jgi:hypothetical protein
VHVQVTYQPIGKDEVQRIREGEDTEDAEDNQVRGSGRAGCYRCYCGVSCGRRLAEADPYIRCIYVAP